MKSTEIAFCSFKQFGYLSLHNGGNGDSVELFHLFIHDKAFKCLNNKAFKCLKNQSFFLAISSNVSYVPEHRKRR